MIALWALIAAASLAYTFGAKADLLKPAVTLGPVAIANGTATLSGALGPGQTAGVTLTVNGQPVSVAADGTFSANVNLSGQSDLAIAVTNPTTGEAVTTRIPLTTDVIGPDGVIPADVLDSLEQAGVALTKPLEGFQILDGQPLEVAGTVADGDQLGGLTVNGADVLQSLGADRGFSQVIPGTSREVSVTATDRHGVSQTSSYGIQSGSSVIQTRAGLSIAAAGANGVRIAKIRYITKRVRQTKRMSMLVTVKDRQGRLIRDAIVRVRSGGTKAQRKRVAGGQQVKLSNKVGQANFVVRLSKRALGKRVFMLTVAKTPRASVKKTTSVRLPRAKARGR